MYKQVFRVIIRGNMVAINRNAFMLLCNEKFIVTWIVDNTEKWVLFVVHTNTNGYLPS